MEHLPGPGIASHRGSVLTARRGRPPASGPWRLPQTFSSMSPAQGPQLPGSREERALSCFTQVLRLAWLPFLPHPIKADHRHYSLPSSSLAPLTFSRQFWKLLIAFISLSPRGTLEIAGVISSLSSAGWRGEAGRMRLLPKGNWGGRKIRSQQSCQGTRVTGHHRALMTAWMLASLCQKQQPHPRTTLQHLCVPMCSSDAVFTHCHPGGVLLFFREPTCAACFPPSLGNPIFL